MVKNNNNDYLLLRFKYYLLDTATLSMSNTSVNSYGNFLR